MWKVKCLKIIRRLVRHRGGTAGRRKPDLIWSHNEIMAGMFPYARLVPPFYRHSFSDGGRFSARPPSRPGGTTEDGTADGVGGGEPRGFPLFRLYVDITISNLIELYEAKNNWSSVILKY